MRKLLVISLAALISRGEFALAQANADVPVSKVVLFSSGVGYFEHAGTVRGNGATQLRFRTSQINDILKSIVLQDQDGGRVGAISYPSQDPLAKTLKSFQVDITQNPSQADLLNQLRGARVAVQTKGTTLTGTILGVEIQHRSDKSDKGEPTPIAVLNLLSGATIRAIELPSITSISLDDPQLQEELTKALSALVQARDQDKKPVTINFAGTGERRVRIGYVVETPIWKTSYRLMLNDKGTSGKLQGWAIVENQTESDWNNVSLSLVSGRPISFKMDLYQPLYSTRPTIVPELFANLRPQIYEGGLRTRADSLVQKAEARRIGFDGSGSLSAMRLDAVVVTSAGESGTMDAYSSVRSIAEASRLGALFQYSVPNVTLARQKSAMLPIITDSIELERVSIYNTGVLASNPLNGVWFRNTTGKHLLQGPFTVLDGGGYAGDARIDNVPPGQSRLLSYGIDLDVTMNGSANAVSSTVTSARLNKGLLTLTRKSVSQHAYMADNKSEKAKSLIIEHQFNPAWKLVETPAPFETTPTLYRFKVSAAANRITTFVVKEEYVQDEAYRILPMDLAQLVMYRSTGEIPKNIRDALARVVEMKQAIADVDRDVAAANQRIGEITAEQGRIRENMKTVEKSGSYYERLLAKLNEQESLIEKLQVQRDSLNTRRDILRRELEEYLTGLTL